MKWPNGQWPKMHLFYLYMGLKVNNYWAIKLVFHNKGGFYYMPFGRGMPRK
jgi:hypothetical protein